MRTNLSVLENGQMYIQKKPTMYPPWDSTFDAHIIKGRVMQIIVRGKNVDLISETTVELYSLAERCRKNNGRTEIWVCVGVMSVISSVCTMC
jgi:novel protein kinase C theta type